MRPGEAAGRGGLRPGVAGGRASGMGMMETWAGDMGGEEVEGEGGIIWALSEDKGSRGSDVHSGLE